MKRFLIAATVVSSLFGISSSAYSQVVHMESLHGEAWGACAYVNHELICNTPAVQTFANGRQVSGLYLYNCKSGKMTVKDSTVTMDGATEGKYEQSFEEWTIDTEAERKFVSEKCRNFEVVSGGEDGLLADRYYKFEYTPDGRLTCKDTRNNRLRPLERCREAMKTR
jgi:hypothetical protein